MRGYIVVRFTIRGVLFHSIDNENYSQFAHLLLIHLMNFKTYPHRPLPFAHHSFIVLYHTPPLISHSIISPQITHSIVPLNLQKHTPHSKYLYP